MTGIKRSLTDQNANFSWNNFIARFLAQLIYSLSGQIKLLKFLPFVTYPVDAGTMLTDAFKFVRKRQDNL